MADYRKHYEDIRGAGASVAAISVDPPEKSEPVRQELWLPFPILCDTERRVVQDWGIYNAREKGGIAIPAVFLIGRDRLVLYHSIDSVSARVPASEIVRVLRANSGVKPARRTLCIPRPADWFRAVRNAVRFGIRSGRS